MSRLIFSTNRKMDRGIFVGIVFAIFFAFGIVNTTFAQVKETEALDRRKSPLSIAKVKHNDTYIKITYSRPIKRGRDIFGGLVPYGKVWRTGANEATEITVTQPIQFGGKKVEAGTYALFTIPGKKEWTVILNNKLGQWGAYEYEKSKDYLRLKTPRKTVKDTTVKAFSIKFSKPKNNSTTLSMTWDHTRVNIPIRFRDGS